MGSSAEWPTVEHRRKAWLGVGRPTIIGCIQSEMLNCEGQAAQAGRGVPRCPRPGAARALPGIGRYLPQRLGERASAALGFTVDTTAPSLTVTAAPGATVEATSSAGATVSFAASASDLVQGTDEVSFTDNGKPVSAGSAFALGSHDVVPAAKNAAGNVSSTEIKFSVVDTTAPVLTATARSLG